MIKLFIILAGDHASTMGVFCSCGHSLTTRTVVMLIHTMHACSFQLSLRISVCPSTREDQNGVYLPSLKARIL